MGVVLRVQVPATVALTWIELGVGAGAATAGFEIRVGSVLNLWIRPIAIRALTTF
jgi:hypothetical protein